jgi:hypothetical protein
MKVLQDGVWGSCCHIPLSTNGATVNVELAYITAITSDDLATVSSGSKDLSPLQVNHPKNCLDSLLTK